MDDAKQRLRTALPHLLAAIEDVERSHPGAKAVLKIAAQNPDGGGKMLISINEPKQLIADMALVAGVDLDDEQRAEYKARQFLKNFGLEQ